MGNQQEEIGISKAREDARQFLFGFTNSDLLHPSSIKELELDTFFDAFLKSSAEVEISSAQMFSEDYFADSPFKIRVYSTYEKERLDQIRDKKAECVEKLNKMKQFGNRCKNFDSQLEVELNSGKEMLISAIGNKFQTKEDVLRASDILGPVYCRVGSLPRDDDFVDQMDRYLSFLDSPYYRLTPYIWVESVLWAHRMQEDKSIERGDYMDTVWAAAYLPFVDFFVTDNAFCRLLNDSGLAAKYDARVYSLKTLDQFLITLRSTLDSNR